jgi:hypothetical protein
MNFHNFSICLMIKKFCGECPDTLGFLRKNIVSVVRYISIGFLNYVKISPAGL